MAAQTSISLSEARQLAISCQLLSPDHKPIPGPPGVADTVNRLGYVQLDTISVIERAHHHILWTRLPDYQPDYLHQCLALERSVFEYWAHAAAYMPMQDYRFYLQRMRSFRSMKTSWMEVRRKQAKPVMKKVLERIKKEGALGSRDFVPPEGDKRGPWWDWRPSKVALELLFWQGDLMISERRNFHRLYDLPERVLPDHVDTREPDDLEMGQFFVRRAIQAHGIISERGMRAHLAGATREQLKLGINALREAGEMVELEVDSLPGTYFAYSKRQNGAFRQRPLHVLSPFDNLVIQRKRIQALFDFDYTIECYVPAPKRKFGYFVLPVIWGDKLVARFDPKADRKQKKLLLRNLVFEDDFTPDDEFLTALAIKLWQMAEFNGCTRIVQETSVPAKIRNFLKPFLKTHRATSGISR